MTIDLDAIKARLAMATPGPWISGDNDLHSTCNKCALEGCPECDYKGSQSLIQPGPLGQFYSCHDAELCAHAPTDLRNLIAALEAERAEVERLTAIRHLMAK